jgi:hypothetical protein
MRPPRFLQCLALCSLVIAVPLHVVRGPGGEPRLGIDLTVGTDAVQVLVDTGSAGLRLLANALHSGSANRTGKGAAGGYGSGLRLQGEEALASLGVGSAHANAVPIELVDGYSWAMPGLNRTPEMFGQLFPGILGLSMMVPQRGRCCTNPLPALSDGVGKRYIVHAAFNGPQVLLDPDDATIQNFTMADIGDSGWPQGCITVDDLLPYDFCGEVLFDTGTPQLMIVGTGIDTPGAAARGAVAHLRISDWNHDFVSGGPMRVIVRRGPANRIIVGLAALQQIDVLFDYDAHKIGVRSL